MKNKEHGMVFDPDPQIRITEVPELVSSSKLKEAFLHIADSLLDAYLEKEFALIQQHLLNQYLVEGKKSYKASEIKKDAEELVKSFILSELEQNGLIESTIDEKCEVYYRITQGVS